eukprot:scaffold990_cov279-Pinguiococcus_pyrenoidosus.AAC.9
MEVIDASSPPNRHPSSRDSGHPPRASSMSQHAGNTEAAPTSAVGAAEEKGNAVEGCEVTPATDSQDAAAGRKRKRSQQLLSDPDAEKELLAKFKAIIDRRPEW